MIIPCDDANGCGTIMPMPNMAPGTTVDPITEIPYERMNNFTAASQINRQTAQSNSGASTQTQMNPNNPNRTSPIPAQIPGTTDSPTVTGTIATTPTPTGADFIDGTIADPTPGTNFFPETPNFTVPQNPLLPPGYQEILDYESLQYLNGFIRTQIGKYIRVQQLIGSSVIEDRYGYLVGVGINYILLQELSTDNIIALDFYNIKYIYIYYTNPDLPTNGSR